MEEAHLHEIIAELPFIDDFFHDIGILEDEFHQTGVTQTGIGIELVGFPGLKRHITFTQLLVLIVHVTLGTLRGLHGDLQLGAHLQHLHQTGTHRLDTTGHRRADACHRGTWAQHLWEPFCHALADLLHLFLTKAREFSPAVLGIPHHKVHLLQHFLPFWCQLVEAVGLLHHDIGDIIAAAAADVTRAVTSVVGDIEGFLTFGRRGQRRSDAVRIDIIVAGGIRGGLPDQLLHLRLSPCRGDHAQCTANS